MPILNHGKTYIQAIISSRFHKVVWKQVFKDVNQQQNTQERLSYPEHTIKVGDSVIPVTKTCLKTGLQNLDYAKD